MCTRTNTHTRGGRTRTQPGSHAHTWLTANGPQGGTAERAGGDVRSRALRQQDKGGQAAIDWALHQGRGDLLPQTCLSPNRETGTWLLVLPFCCAVAVFCYGCERHKPFASNGCVLADKNLRSFLGVGVWVGWGSGGSGGCVAPVTTDETIAWPFFSWFEDGYETKYLQKILFAP